MNKAPDLDEAGEVSPSGAESSSSQGAKFASPAQQDEYTDGREKWEWKSKYPPEARGEIRLEARYLVSLFAVSVVLAGVFLGLANHTVQVPLMFLSASQPTGVHPVQAMGHPVLNVDFRLLAIFFVGWVGGVTYSIKWLVHSAAKGMWHLDRRYWRLLIPFLGGAYACVVLTLFDAGFFAGAKSSSDDGSVSIAAAFAFLVGYFSDGVSGLLSNVANAVFGTLKK